MSGRGTGEPANSQELTSYRLKDLIKEVQETPPGLKTGYAGLDKLIWIPREGLTIIAGRPKHGKTSFQLNLLVNFLRDPVNKRQEFYFFSYEEARKYIATKLIMIMAGTILQFDDNQTAYLNYLKYRSRPKHRKDPKIEEAIKKYDKLSSANQLFIFDDHFKFKELASKLKRLGNNGKVGAVFIDYIQRVPYGQTNFGMARYEQIKDISATLLEISQKNNFPIIMGAQLRRSSSTKNPGLSSLNLDYLRESGDIEQDAHLVLGIYNHGKDKKRMKTRRQMVSPK